mmetsp:Transcript_6962/g.9056  ORF Transcript_6962/g.9056 Transcript_6962/m.9056 type:complete len:204 (-) Transcript_6962:154-765(-)
MSALPFLFLRGGRGGLQVATTAAAVTAKRALLVASSSAAPAAGQPPVSPWRMFSTDANGLFFHVKASNAAKDDCTQLVVTGPDADGALASMTIALALEGCSVVNLQAAKQKQDEIQNTVSVVHQKTGTKFKDEELPNLARSVLQALSNNTNSDEASVAISAAADADADASAPASKEFSFTPSELDKHITIVPATATTAGTGKS